MLWTWPFYNWSNSPQDPVLFQNARLINQDSHAQYSDQWSKQIRNKNTKCKWFSTMCWCLHSLRNQALLLRSKATKNRWWLQRAKMTNTFSLFSTLLSLSLMMMKMAPEPDYIFCFLGLSLQQISRQNQ